MSRSRNPFRGGGRRYVEPEEQPSWLPARRSVPRSKNVEPEAEAPDPRAAEVLAWSALKGVVPAVHGVLGVLELCQIPHASTVGVEVGRALDAVEHRGSSAVPRHVKRQEFMDAAASFRAFASLVALVAREVRAEEPAVKGEVLELLAEASDNLVVELRKCEEPLMAYVREIKRLKAMERLGMGRSR